jgi:phosphate uptake regulator
MVKSEPRRLIKFGNSSYIISIPKEWIDKNDLKKGDILYLENNDDHIIITLKDKKRPTSKRITISLANKDIDNLRREFTSAYINNYNEIILEGKNEKKRNELINKVIQEKVGIEIVEQTDTQTIIKDILDLEAVSFDKITRRLDNVIRSMFEDVISALKMESFKEWTAKEINQADTEVNKLYFLIWKIVRKCQEEPRLGAGLKVTPKELSDTQWLSLHIEYIGDNLKRIAKLLISMKLDSESRKKVLGITSLFEKDYLGAINAYYTNDKMLARKIAGMKHDHQKFCSNFCEECPSAQIVGEKFREIANSIHNIAKIIAY